MRYLCLALLCLVSVKLNAAGIATTRPTFEVDWKNNGFLKDGKPFRFIGGSFHYFRAHPDSWERKLRTLRASGLNAVTTYVEWSLHNPKEGYYVWNGIADLERFIKLAAEQDLLVILRPGPYICAERDFGGIPYWILRKYPNIYLRSADINYLYEVRLWYAKLMSRMQRYLYGNGGPIIMVQVENEYGSYDACDKEYREWLRDETLAYIKDNAVLFTTDGPLPYMLQCGQIENVLTTIDFGPNDNETSSYWDELRQIQPSGPLVNSEYYPGWLTHWMEPMSRLSTKLVIPTFIEMLNDGANVNFYMFHGGTNFGFTAGANIGGPGRYHADITSYDYDAPMDESGDPTEKYFKIREVVSRYLPMPNISVPTPLPKKAYGVISLKPCCSILSRQGRKILSTGVVRANKPKTFEALDQYSGLMLYETILPQLKYDPVVLKVNGVRDRAYVYVDGMLAGILSREAIAFELPISPSSDRRLQILVENQGRINYGPMDDFKGIVSDVFLGEKVVKNWNMTKYPLESYEDIAKLIELTENPITPGNTMLHSGPVIYHGEFEINDEIVHDTYIDTSGWGKGLIFVNGENLGRYWPLAGPQITIFVPREVLKVGINKIVVLEYQRPSISSEITLTDKANFGRKKDV